MHVYACEYTCVHEHARSREAPKTQKKKAKQPCVYIHALTESQQIGQNMMLSLLEAIVRRFEAILGVWDARRAV
jgi:hypothetical protein